MTPPCKDCQKRHLGCHGSCEEYKTWSVDNYKRKHKPPQESTEFKAKRFGGERLERYRNR